MKFELEVQDNKVAFFLELIKGFKFIKANPVNADNDVSLSDELKIALDESIESKNTTPHLEVMEETKKRYPNLFK